MCITCMLQYTSRTCACVCRQDRTNRERGAFTIEKLCICMSNRGLCAHALQKGPAKGAPLQASLPLWPEGACGAHLLRGAISHPRSSAGGHCPLMMRLTVSLSLHSATFCFPMLAPPPRSSRQGLLERRPAASAAAYRVAHARRGGSSALPQPHALPLPPGSGAAGGPAAVGGVRPQSAQACSWLLRWALLCSALLCWALLCSALLCAPPSDSRRLACAAAYRSAHDDRRGEA